MYLILGEYGRIYSTKNICVYKKIAVPLQAIDIKTMDKGIILHSIVPVRSEANEASEQVTQLLFAETVEVIEEQPSWIRIKNDADAQEGWVDFKMLTRLSQSECEKFAKCSKIARVKMPMAYAVSENNSQTIPLTAGTCLPDYKDGRFELLGVGFLIDPGMVAQSPLELNPTNMMNTVRFFLNIPYLWGGKNAMGMDCSGFSQIVHSLFGHNLLRNASEQAQQGMVVTSFDEVQVGDLAFFDHNDGKISHVGIILDKERIIHCSGRIKVEKLDQTGIYSIEQGGTYTHHLVSIRRY